MTISAVIENGIDGDADRAITDCLDLNAPKSFFLYAGAGSGKTRSLVDAVREVIREQGRHLALGAQKIGIITYTNAASKEIVQRLDFDPRVEVSTIHSFSWELITGYDSDIRAWLRKRLTEDIKELESLQAKGRPSSQAATIRARSIESKRERIAGLDSIRKFVYSPTGDSQGRGSLNHAEVISMTAELLLTKTGLRRLLVSRFPILFIDESQDTNEMLLDSLLAVQAEHSKSFCLGLFGDTMQRIYPEGKENLAQVIPAEWARPRKVMNHRCPKRVVELINKIRSDADGDTQQARNDAAVGFVRIFLAPEAASNRSELETKVCERMAAITKDAEWSIDKNVKKLALEHLMSARRFGFDTFFTPLYTNDRTRAGLQNGLGQGIGFLIRDLLPLSLALMTDDRFSVASVIFRASPILNKEALEAAGANQQELLVQARESCDGLKRLLMNGESPSIRNVLQYVAENNLLLIPDILKPFAIAEDASLVDEPATKDDVLDAKSEIGAWAIALEAPFTEISRYAQYVAGTSQFDTHQGVKGLEFPRVLLIISDNETRGFLFSYGKLLGTKEKTKTDIEHEAAGKETSLDRTRRLFYVTCSRAEKSLAIVFYSDAPEAAKSALISQGWFEPSEIEFIS